MLPALKTINYRGGVIRFRIPSDWLEEYEDAGGGTFYKPGVETGTLRVNVITGEGPPEKLRTVDDLAGLLTSPSESYGATPIQFGENAVIFRYDMPGEERGQSLTIRCWGILQALPPKNFRHVLFTYTLLTDQFSDPARIAEMDLLDREIEAALLSPRLGRLM
jgi:hypothetical protein